MKALTLVLFIVLVVSWLFISATPFDIVFQAIVIAQEDNGNVGQGEGGQNDGGQVVQKISEFE